MKKQEGLLVAFIILSFVVALDLFLVKLGFPRYGELYAKAQAVEEVSKEVRLFCYRLDLAVDVLFAREKTSGAGKKNDFYVSEETYHDIWLITIRDSADGKLVWGIERDRLKAGRIKSLADDAAFAIYYAVHSKIPSADGVAATF